MALCLEALDRLDTVAACYRALEGLICPDDNQAVNRDDLAVLIHFINTEHRHAIAALSHKAVVDIINQ